MKNHDFTVVEQVASLDRPLVVFDSGSGGLSVLQSLLAQPLPTDYLYFADSHHLPYGDKSDAFIQDRLHVIVERLQQACQPKGLVIACNTATAAAIDSLRKTYQTQDFPIFGIEPGIKPAVAATRNGHVSVLATTATVHSERFHALLRQYGEKVTIHLHPAPDLVPVIEAFLADVSSGRAARQHLADCVDTYLADIHQAGSDTLLLGCTHYNILINYIYKNSLKKSLNIMDNRNGLIKNIIKYYNSIEADTPLLSLKLLLSDQERSFKNKKEIFNKYNKIKSFV